MTPDGADDHGRVHRNGRRRFALRSNTLGSFAFALLILHGIIDSADGQLARMTGQVTELGRVLDGVGGYVTHVAIYLAIAADFFIAARPAPMSFWMVLAADCDSYAQPRCTNIIGTHYIDDRNEAERCRSTIRTTKCAASGSRGFIAVILGSSA